MKFLVSAEKKLARAWWFAESFLALSYLVGCLGIFFSIHHLKSHLDGPYQENIEALRESLTGIDHHLLLLREETREFDTYLTTLRTQILEIQGHIASTETQAKELTKVAGSSVPTTLRNVSGTLEEASKVLRASANKMGNVPSDPFAEERNGIYAIAGHMNSESKNLAALSSHLKNAIETLGRSASGGMNDASIVLKETAYLLETVQKGSLKQFPATMDTLSIQLRTHVTFLEDSRDLIHRASLPITFVGIVFACRGLMLVGRILIRRRPAEGSPHNPSND